MGGSFPLNLKGMNDHTFNLIDFYVQIALFARCDRKD